MAEVQSTADPFSLQSRIERCEQRVARQREIVEDLIKYNVAGPAQRLLALMEQALAELREQERARSRQADEPAPASEPARECNSVAAGDRHDRVTRDARASRRERGDIICESMTSRMGAPIAVA